MAATKTNEDGWEVREGCELSPLGLSDAVKNCSMQFVKTYGGSDGLAKALSSNKDSGLPSSFDYEKRRATYGKNYVELPPLKTYLALVAEGFEDPIILMLLAAAIVSLVIGLLVEQNWSTGWLEGAAISFSIAIVINVGAGTEWSKERSFRKQQLALENTAAVTVIRDGKDSEINPREIVVGDLIRINYGCTIPADGYIVESNDIKVDESALTGEPILMAKRPDATHGEKFFLMSGTQVQIGSGKMIVCAVGANSVKGRIQQSIAEQEKTEKKDAGSEEADEGEQKTKSAEAESVETFGEGRGMGQKLDVLATQIGYVGGVVALICFVGMTVAWIIDLTTGVCKDTDGIEIRANHSVYASWNISNVVTLCADKAGCTWNADTCEREFDWEFDPNKVLGFFITAITILVVAIPEGLPLAVTLSLAIAQRRLLSRQNMVRHLDACETMGSATTVCSDKTGTLTMNRMTVMRAYVARQHFSASNTDGGSIHEHMKKEASPALLSILTDAICANCSPTSHVTRSAHSSGKDDHHKFEYKGNPTECALLKLSVLLGADYRSRTTKYASPPGSALDWGVKTFPFSSQRKKMSWVVRNGSGYRLFCKGAPKALYTTSKDFLLADGVSKQTMTPADVESLRKTILTYENLAMRTLALAYRDFDDVPKGGWNVKEGEGETAVNVAERGLTLIGIVGIEDPLRPDVPGAIAQCRRAGVDVRMCTGDSLPTAIAIAKGCNILAKRDFHPPDENGYERPLKNFAMTGAEFDERVHKIDTSKPKIMRRFFDPKTQSHSDAMAYPFLRDERGRKIIDQSEFDEIWPKLRVLARCQPEDKLTLVKGLRSSTVFGNTARLKALKAQFDIDIFPDYQVVAVTGDGTNDAPALKAADVGFAMGITGTDVAKSACDIIIMDDNFSTIVTAMLWGRNVFDSIAKFIQFQLTVNIVALTTAVIGAFTFNASPLGAVQMLWVNLIMDSFASVALATEPPVPDLLERPPYGKRRQMISRTMWFNMIGQSIYQVFVVMYLLFEGHNFVEANQCYIYDEHGFPKNPEDCSEIPTDPYYNENYPNLVRYPPRGGLVDDHGTPSEHWSVIFNAFVMLQVFNEFNSRKLQTAKNLKSDWKEWIVFFGVQNNPTFLVIVVGTFLVQIVLMQFWYYPFTVLPLSFNQWVICVVFGAGSLVVQFFINAAIVAASIAFPEDEVGLVKPSGATSKVVPFDSDSSGESSTGTNGKTRSASRLFQPKRIKDADKMPNREETRELEKKVSGMGKVQLLNSTRIKHNEHPDYVKNRALTHDNEYKNFTK